MVRILKEEDYAARRNEILDAAYQLVYSKGYEQMTIQDILEKLQISKGAFYHYFDSKQDLLEALCDRLLDESEKLLLPVVNDQRLSGLDKINAYFSTAGRWKTTHKAYLMKLLYTWYTDDNAIVRQKVAAKALERITPLLSTFIQQGIREGSMNNPYPERAGEIILSLFISMGDTFSNLLLVHQKSDNELQLARETVAAYISALERVLGTASGCLHVIDDDLLEEWFSPSSLETVSMGNEAIGALREAGTP